MTIIDQGLWACFQRERAGRGRLWRHIDGNGRGGTARRHAANQEEDYHPSYNALSNVPADGCRISHGITSSLSVEMASGPTPQPPPHPPRMERGRHFRQIAATISAIS